MRKFCEQYIVTVQEFVIGSGGGRDPWSLQLVVALLTNSSSFYSVIVDSYFCVRTEMLWHQPRGDHIGSAPG